MRVAVLGATSLIASDFIRAAASSASMQLSLFARRPETVVEWANKLQLQGIVSIQSFEGFNSQNTYDVVINFVGIANPSAMKTMGKQILSITQEFDALVLQYLQHHTECRYIFLSSGAAYGGNFAKPADDNSIATVPLNDMQPQDWYGTAKLQTECCHRSNVDLPIVDVRIFNYFSRYQDVSARFLITDIVRAIKEKKNLQVSSDNIVRDFLHPDDFFHLIDQILSSPATNTVIDAYSRAPIDKISLLQSMQERFGLVYRLVDQAGVDASGNKMHYYSLSRRAEQFAYKPLWTSRAGVCAEAEALLNL